MSDILREEALERLLQGMKKHSSLDRKFAGMLLTVIKKYLDEMNLVRGKFKIDMRFFDWFIKDMDLKNRSETKEENTLYKNFNRLKKFGLIHQRSAVFFPKSLTLVSINPNHFSLQAADLSKMDTFIEAREKVMNHIEDSQNLLQALYIYLRLFCIKPFSKSELEEIDLANVLLLPTGKAIILLKQQLLFENATDNGMYRLIVLDTYASKVISRIREDKTEGSLFDMEDYEVRITEFRKNYLPDISMHMLKHLNKCFYLFSTSPLELTCKAKVVPTVELTLSEVDALYPGIVPPEMMEVEKKRISTIFAKNKVMPETGKAEDFEEDIADMEFLMALLRKKGNQATQDEIRDAQKEIEEYLDYNRSMHSELIYVYILYLLNFLYHRKLKLSTVKNYITSLNKHLFRNIKDLSDIQTHELQSISKRLEMMNYKGATVRFIYNQIRKFFKFHRRTHPEFADISMLFYPKSMVFDHEVDRVLNDLEEKYIQTHQLQRIGSKHYFKILQYKALVLLGYYFGLRRNEARSRLVEDIYYYGNTFYMDVNRKGLKKIKLNLKTRSSKRRVKAVIDNPAHLDLLKEWLSLRKGMDKRSPFLFLDTSKSGGLLTRVINESVFDEINASIQEVTQRYCTYHSLRHSFATYRFAQVMESQNETPYALMELSMQLGHETPDTTLSSYVHSRLFEIF